MKLGPFIRLGSVNEWNKECVSIIFSGLPGVVTHTVVAIVEVSSPWVIHRLCMQIYDHIFCYFMCKVSIKKTQKQHISEKL